MRGLFSGVGGVQPPIRPQLGPGEYALAVGVNGQTVRVDPSGVAAIDPGWSEKSGTVYRIIPGWVQNTRSTSVVQSGTYYVPIVVDVPMYLSDARIDVTATGTATLFRVGVYAAGTGSNSHQPAVLVADMGSASVATTGTKIITSSILLLPGRYLVAYTANGTVTVNVSIGAPRGVASWVDLSNNNMTANLLSSTEQTAGFAASGLPWTLWFGENRGWYMPVYFTRTA